MDRRSVRSDNEQGAINIGSGSPCIAYAAHYPFRVRININFKSSYDRVTDAALWCLDQWGPAAYRHTLWDKRINPASLTYAKFDSIWNHDWEEFFFKRESDAVLFATIWR